MNICVYVVKCWNSLTWTENGSAEGWWECDCRRGRHELGRWSVGQLIAIPKDDQGMNIPGSTSTRIPRNESKHHNRNIGLNSYIVPQIQLPANQFISKDDKTPSKR
jgi:hypothetical protein